jgi:fluoride exporter
VTRPAPPATTLVAVALGGAVGGLLRWGAGELTPDPNAFPWTTLAINVVGSLLLALLPAVTVVRRSPTLAAGLGPGVLGGFTTLSAYADQARGLVGDGRAVAAVAYLLVTLIACLAAVVLARRWTSPGERAEWATEDGNE